MTDTLVSASSSPIAQEIAGKVIGAISERPSSVGMWHIVLAICGALLYNLVRLDKLRKENKKFKFSEWLSDNYISLIISAISLVAIFLLKDELKDIAGFDMSNRFGCFWAGFTAHSLISLLKGVAISRGYKSHDSEQYQSPTSSSINNN